jgi:hypothetical protein
MPIQQFNYGQKYGDWRNYAGYTDKETGEYNFGPDPTKATAPVPPPGPTNVMKEGEGNAPFIPPSIAMPPIGISSMGFKPTNMMPNYFDTKQSVFDQFSSHIGD